MNQLTTVPRTEPSSFSNMQLNRQEDYNDLTNSDLSQLFRDKTQEIKQFYIDSLACKESSKSQEYSMIVLNAENSWRDLCGIRAVLIKRNVKIDEDVLKECSQIGHEIHANIPQGQSQFLIKDMIDFGKLNETAELRKFFFEYACRGLYQNSVTVRENVMLNDSSAIEIILRHPKKNDSWITKGMEKIKECVSFFTHNIWLAQSGDFSHRPDQSKKQVGSLKQEDQGSSECEQTQMKSKPIDELSQARHEVLKELQEILPEKIKEWNFESFIILPSEDTDDKEGASRVDRIFLILRKSFSDNPGIAD